jgi:hypothetical protein
MPVESREHVLQYPRRSGRLISFCKHGVDVISERAIDHAQVRLVHLLDLWSPKASTITNREETVTQEREIREGDSVFGTRFQVETGKQRTESVSRRLACQFGLVDNIKPCLCQSLSISHLYMIAHSPQRHDQPSGPIFPLVEFRVGPVRWKIRQSVIHQAERV